MSDPVLHEQDGFVVTLALNRPEARNAITEMEVVDALVDSVSTSVL